MPSSRFVPASLAVVLTLFAAGCGGGDEPASNDASKNAAGDQAATAPSSDAPSQVPSELFTGTPPAAEPIDGAAVLVKIGDQTITNDDVDARISAVMAAQMGMAPPPEQIAQFRPMMAERVIEELIDERLLDADAAEAGIAPTDEEFLAEFQTEIDLFLSFENIERDEFVARVEEMEGVPFSEFLTKGAANEDFRRGARHVRALKAHYPEETAISDEQVSERYAAELESSWTRAEEVRASHILFKIPPSPPEAAEAARAEAARVLELARAEGADFAALAREHSEGPSAPTGGDLGFFERADMVAPFSEAAFAMEVGDVSDLVETQFGLHVIHVTERRDEAVIPLEEAAPLVRRILLNERLVELRTQLVEKLRSEATIERT